MSIFKKKTDAPAEAAQLETKEQPKYTKDQVLQAGLDIIDAMRVSVIQKTTGAMLENYIAGISKNTDVFDEQRRVLNAINESSSEMENHMNDIMSSYDENEVRVDEGADTVGKILGAVESVENTNKEFRSKCEDLGNGIQEIVEYMDDINSISSQTNLLALNASIEAARAGDAGKGFAVVAEEVRKLSDDTKKTSAKIQQTIDNLTEKMNEVIEGSNKNDELLKALRDATDTSLGKFDEIRGSSNESKNRIHGLIDQMHVNSDRVGQATECMTNLERLEDSNKEGIVAINNEISKEIMQTGDMLSFLMQMRSIITYLKENE